jgi:hypothetical protein
MIMSYINVGAWINDRLPASKKAVREAFAADPSSVVFFQTSPMGPQLPGGEIRGDELGLLDEKTTLSLVGPDPERNRKFYGNVTKT